MQGIEAVQFKEIVETGRVYRVARLAGLLVCRGLPEPGGHGHLHQEPEFLLRVAQFHPVAQILARLAPVVAVTAQPVGQPNSPDINETKRQLGALADARLVDVRDVIEHLDVLHDLPDLIVGQVIGLAVEPQRHVAQRAAAQRVALATADEGLAQFLRLVRLFHGVRRFPLLLLLGVELLLGPDQFA